jgi:hypothetical protein
MLPADPVVAITISLETLIALYYIKFPSLLEPPVIEYYHIELPAVSSKLIVLRLLKYDNANKTESYLPIVNPR